MAFTLDTEARGLLPFYAILVQLHTFTVLRQNALTFTLPPPYGTAEFGARAVPLPVRPTGPRATAGGGRGRRDGTSIGNEGKRGGTAPSNRGIAGTRPAPGRGGADLNGTRRHAA